MKSVEIAEVTDGRLTHYPPRLRQSGLLHPDQRVAGGPTYAKLVDISKCIGCKGCEVACKEWEATGATET